MLQKLEEVQHLEEKLETSKYKINDLENQLEEKSLILLNARKALKQERDKLKVISIGLYRQKYFRIDLIL